MSSHVRANIRFSHLFLFGILISAAMTVTGCNTVFRGQPLFAPRTDTIPGILTPKERIEMIRMKGEYGLRSAPEVQRDIMEQLTEEYVNSPDPIIRQEVVTAASKALASSDGSEDDYFSQAAFDLVKYAAMRDEDPFVRREACRVIAVLRREESAAILRHVVRNDLDKDVQLQAAQSLSAFSSEDTIETLRNLLDHRQPALRYEAMQSLKVCTNQDLGNDVGRWKQYLNGETLSPENAPTLAERMRLNQLPMIR